jgi:hypothetical protein
MMLQAQSDSVDQLVEVLTPFRKSSRAGVTVNYYRRVDPALRPEEAKLDGIKHLNILKLLGISEAGTLVDELKDRFKPG